MINSEARVFADSGIEPRRHCHIGVGINRVIAAGLVVGITAFLALPVQIAGATTTAAKTKAIIQNGGFEKPVVPVGSDENFGTGSTFSHWTVIGAEGSVAVLSGKLVYDGLGFPARLATSAWT